MNITEAAGTYFDGLLRRIQAPQGTVIRLVPDSGHLSLETDTPQPEDKVFKTFDNGGKQVLAVTRQVDAMLSHRTLDVETTDDGVTLVLMTEH